MIIYIALFFTIKPYQQNVYVLFLTINMKDKIYDKILLIDRDLTFRNKSINNVSLFSGLGGLPIFYFLMYRLTKKDEYINKIHETLEDIVEILNTSEYGLTYCNGLVGIGYMFNFLRSKEILTDEFNNEIKDSLEFIDDSIVSFSLTNTETIDDTDFLHGSFGAAFYLNERLKDNSNVELKQSVILLFEKLANIVLNDIENAKKVRNVTDYDDNTHRTNCGLAHGHISHIIIFSKFLENFPNNKLIYQALTECISCLLDFENDNENNLSQFPSIAINKLTAKYDVPLGWCYGDQTISIGLYKASKILNDEILREKSLKLAYQNLKRNTIEKIYPLLLYDAGFCHGLSSIAYLHKKWFVISEDKKFYDLYEKFILEIIDFGDTSVGIGGYQKYLGNDRHEDTIGLLDGAIGIGIVLIDYLLEEEDCGWDGLFLLN